MARIAPLLKASAATLPHVRAVAPRFVRILRLVIVRSNATLAQPQLDHDYNYYKQNEYESNIRLENMRSAPVNDSEGWEPPRGVQWVFMGGPGAKKSVYAKKLSELLEVPHISMASLVRQDLSPRSSLYKQIANAVNHGELVPEEIIFGLLSKRLEYGYRNRETGFILDGIPRTQIQAEILDKLVDIDLVVNFKCAENCLLEHHGNGIFSNSCQSDSFSSSACASFDVAQDIQSKFSLGNSENSWKEKVSVYSKQVKSLEDYYKKQKKLIDFQVRSAPGETWQKLLAALHL
ncbi:probable adenylate kinase 7, mitochondrial [Diospyros lotus]|uniref:probable adenylate kinase 7, mitochondrial n=1 Tax=Diospyros lotus TaxID=55363 RepID=UPI002255C759|nr:probable adenylate kinase 7, mitochondrial [Diospyros lotus]